MTKASRRQAMPPRPGRSTSGRCDASSRPRSSSRCSWPSSSVGSASRATTTGPAVRECRGQHRAAPTAGGVQPVRAATGSLQRPWRQGLKASAGVYDRAARAVSGALQEADTSETVASRTEEALSLGRRARRGEPDRRVLGGDRQVREHGQPRVRHRRRPRPERCDVRQGPWHSRTRSPPSGP